MGMWMAHIPPKLASVWNDAPEGTILGTLTFTKGGGKSSFKQQNTNTKQNQINSKIRTMKGPNNSNQKVNSKHSMTVNIAPELGDKNPDLPPVYTIENISKKINGVMHPFTRENNNDGNTKINLDGNNVNSNSNITDPSNENKNASSCASTITLHGTVTTSCHFQISRDMSISSSKQSQQYRNLCKKRLMENNNHKRVVKPVDSSELSLRRATATAVLTGLFILHSCNNFYSSKMMFFIQ